MHNRITALGLSVKVWTSLPCRRPPSVRDLEGKQQNPPSIHVIPEVEHASARPLPFGGSTGRRGGAILDCTMKEMKHVPFMLCRPQHPAPSQLSCGDHRVSVALALESCGEPSRPLQPTARFPGEESERRVRTWFGESGVRRVTIPGHLTI